MRLSSIAFLVPDYDSAIAFFTQTLRFQLLEDTDMGEGKRWVRVGSADGGTDLLLSKARNAEQQAAVGNQGGGRVWLFVKTEDFWADHARMKAAGVHFLEEPRRETYGTVVVFEDPWGNRWDFIGPAEV